MPQMKSLKTLIPLETLIDQPVRHSIMTGFNALLERILSVDKIRSVYDSIPGCRDPFQFLEYTLDRLHIDHTLDDEARRAIPLSGPVIVVANHPFGGIDGMILASALSSVRRDIKILVNYFLENIEELNPLFFPVDPFNHNGATSRNIEAIRKAIHWVKTGRMLVVLPAGEVSHFSLKHRRVEDPAWNTTVGRLVQLTEAPVLPVYFRGRNSALFQIAGLAHPLLRTAMLPRETLKKGGSQVEFKIGRLIPYKTLGRFQDASKLTEYLRFRTYLLGIAEEKRRPGAHPIRPQGRLRKMDPIARPIDPSLAAQEVNGLPPGQKLLTGPEFSVYYARSSQIPMTLREIGRLREETFRPIGEGTGNAIDLDRFDNIYTHLFVWHSERSELVGAYRLGPTVEILPRHGKKGLYTYTLFNYRSRLLDKIGPALELGRTFIRGSYQRDYSPLLLLWKGIGRYIALHPYYKTLFGAVSISNDYRQFSRQLMTAFLKVNNFSSDLSRMIRPRRPLRRNRIISLIREKEDLHQNDLNEISSWISGIEDDGKGVPILLKQYLKLGGKVLCFNVDQQFGDTLDGLMVVDLTLTDPKVLRRYLGEEGLRNFVDYHSGTTHEPSRIGDRSLPSYANTFERNSLEKEIQVLSC
jgi:putative hemolysin